MDSSIGDTGEALINGAKRKARQSRAFPIRQKLVEAYWKVF
jgi:hypothetical protein